jgi:hypothetical protein
VTGLRWFVNQNFCKEVALATPSLQQSKSANANLLAEAAEAGNIVSAEALLAGVADVNAATETGTTPLMRAAKFGHVELVQVLLNKGAEINQVNNDGFTALFFAVFFGQIDVAKLLLQRGADPAVESRFRTSPEMWANTRGFFDIAGLLRDFPSRGSRQAPEVASTEHCLVSPTSSAVAEREETHVERPRALGNDAERLAELKESSAETLEVSPVSVRCANDYGAQIVSPATETTSATNAAINAVGYESVLTDAEASQAVPRQQTSRLWAKPISRFKIRYRRAITAGSGWVVASLAQKTSDWRRVTVATLFLVLVCGVGTILFLKLSNLQAKSQTASLPKSVVENAASQMQGSSLLQVATVPLNEMDVSELPASNKRNATEYFFKTRSLAATKPAGVHKGSTAEVNISSASHSEKTGSANFKQTLVSKEQDRSSTANTTVSMPSRAGITSTSVTSLSRAGPPKSEPNAPETKTTPAPLSIEAQRPRSVESRTESKPTISEANSPIVLRAKGPKTKVIQWP